jgi:anti-sigma regulatory factor (Ser/Thr protein kinase)
MRDVRHLKLVGAEPAVTEDTAEWMLSVPARPADLQVVRSFAASAADEAGLDEAGRFQIVLATSEAVSSAIEHGAPDSEGNIELRAMREPGMLTVYIRDSSGASWEIGDHGPLWERGRGLGFVSLLVDELELRPTSDATEVRLAKRLKQ